MPIRLSSSARRDLTLIGCCSLILFFLVEFRSGVPTKILNRSNGDYYATGPSSSPEAAASLEGLDAEERELLGHVPASSPRRSKHRSSGPSRLKGHHKHASSSRLKPTTFDTHDNKIGSSRVSWGRNEGMPLTDLVAHAPGFTILDNVYSLNGTLYIVRSDTKPGSFPEVRTMISNAGNPSLSLDDNMRIISERQALALFGSQASRVEGATFLCNDEESVISDYYHFTAETLFSLWRAYSSLDLSISPYGETRLPQPRRFIAPHIPTSRWRDYANLNQYILHAAFPSTGVEFQGDWVDRAETLRPYFFDRIVLGDRIAARNAGSGKGRANTGKEGEGIDKAVFQADKMPKSPHWWMPIRNNVVTFAAGEDADALVMAEKKKRQEYSGLTTTTPPVITYVTRQQWGKRMLRDSDHTALVDKLHELKRDNKDWEVNVVQLEELSREEQIRLAARTTVLLGVHGAGLTGLLWMQPTNQTTVVEFLAPGSFSEDFEVVARMVGIKHFTVWGDKSMTYPSLPEKSKLPARGQSLEFDSNEIPVDADAVVALIKRQLQPAEEA
ncbi:hypothetical protein M407DRAFT_31920 [Tulasnella calospora MUT 4182]|uniref:Glycosyltransferase 61 catalytic domain-containing protein n=1 Tax=Tulasnella calospora MUT 4182 TaxID=1051891 RepID=A0A0C3Q4X0_9AGAM|nr:hypothetical protein M407DRAFT_31920 [Tulasnella calospora MUT 4182]